MGAKKCNHCEIEMLKQRINQLQAELEFCKKQEEIAADLNSTRFKN